MRRHLRGQSSFTIPEWVKRSVLYGVLCLGGVILLTLIVISIRVIREWNIRDWYGKEPYRALVVVGQANNEPSSMGVLSVWPDTQKTTYVMLPADLKVNSVGGYGLNRLGALPELGRIEHVGDRLLKDTIWFTLGIPVHEIIYLPLEKGMVRALKFQEMKQALQAKSSMAEALTIWHLLSGIQEKDIQKSSLEKANALDTQTEVDGSEGVYIDGPLLNNFLQNHLGGVWPEAARMEVAIINASGKPKMATNWARLPRFSGFDLVSVTDQQTVQNKTQILVKNIQDSPMELKILSRLFPGNIQITSTDTTSYRSDVAVIVGTDLWQWLNEREFYLKNKF